MTRHLSLDRPRLRLAAVFVSALVGCGGSSDDPSDLPPTSAGTPGDVFEDTHAVSIAFDVGDQVTLIPGETREIVAQVQPPGRHTVRFALLGKAQDAFLSDNLVQTEADGVARTQLTALGAAADFAIRAAAGRVDQTLRVLTQEANDASLFVTAAYGGLRQPSRWFASVHLDRTCNELQGTPFPDGTISASDTDKTVQLERVPADVPLAVVIRGEQYAGGCRGVDPLLANTSTYIQIDVLERPMQIDDLSLSMAFSVEESEELNPALVELAFRAASVLTGAGTDLSSVLDAMSARADDSIAFEQARAGRGWVPLLVAALPPELPGTGLRATVQRLMREGLWNLYAARAIEARLTNPMSSGRLLLDSVVGLPPAQLGFAPESMASITAEKDDYLRIGATLSFSPSPFLAEVANLAARADDPTRASVADALVEEFDCEGVADVLTDAGEQPGEAYSGCSRVCMRTLCEVAMDDLWARVRESNLPSVPWQFLGGARAQVDAEARFARVEGTWVGSLTVPNFPEPPAPVLIQGPFSGSE